MDAELPSAHRDFTAAFVALEGDRTEIPAGLAGFGAVVHEGLRDRRSPEGFLHLALGHQLLGEEHGRAAREIDEIVFGDVGQRLTRRHGEGVR